MSAVCLLLLLCRSNNRYEANRKGFLPMLESRIRMLDQFVNGGGRMKSIVDFLEA